jgi:plastocyanin
LLNLLHLPRGRAVAPAAILVTLTTLAACGGTSYGNGSQLKDKKGAGAALQDPSPSPSAAASVAPAPVVTHSQPPTTTTAPVTHAAPPPAPKPQAQKFAIGIFGDSSGQPQFNPPAAKVYTGTIITFTNHDSVARSVVSDNGAFNSAPIPPGGAWNYTAASVGTFNYHDGTRPYAVAYFQVVNP